MQVLCCQKLDPFCCSGFRAREARTQLEAEAARPETAAEQRMKLLWNPWLGSQAGLGTTAFPRLNILDLAFDSSGGDKSPTINLDDRIPAGRPATEARLL